MCYTIFKKIEVNFFQKDFLKHYLQNGVEYYEIVLTKYMPKAFVFAKLSIVWTFEVGFAKVASFKSQLYTT